MSWSMFRLSQWGQNAVSLSVRNIVRYITTSDHTGVIGDACGQHSQIFVSGISPGIYLRQTTETSRVMLLSDPTVWKAVRFRCQEYSILKECSWDSSITRLGGAEQTRYVCVKAPIHHQTQSDDQLLRETLERTNEIAFPVWVPVATDRIDGLSLIVDQVRKRDPRAKR